MNVPNLYSSKAFYDSTSALNGNPFVNPRTCGVAGTLRGSCLAAFPGGNIGYANRIEGVDGIIDTLVGGAKDVATNVLGFIAPTVGSAVEQLIGTARKTGLEKLGYKFLEVVQVPYQGKTVAGTKVKKPDNTFVVMLSDGTEIPFTTDVARTTQTVNPQTGLPAGAAAGLAVGVVALAALFFFMSKRR
jgi:LPXTG-motif cell wall-anchored protein